jgi:hypothetical protein
MNEQNPLLAKGIAYIAKYYSQYGLIIETDFPYPEDPGQTVSIEVYEQNKKGWIFAVHFFSTPVKGEWVEVVPGNRPNSDELTSRIKTEFVIGFDTLFLRGGR